MKRTWRTSLAPVLILALVLGIVFVVRIRLLNAPLERDEGEHAYGAQMMLAGNAPWKLAYNMKLPGTDALYACFMAVFGQTAAAIRLGLLLVNAATIALAGLLGKKLFGMTGGAVAAACYGLLAASQSVMGTTAHATHFVAFFAIIATLLLLRAGARPAWLFGSGLAYGLAFLMKQPGIAFAAFGAIYLLWRCWRTRTPVFYAFKGLAAFGSGVLLPYALLCLALWRAGIFARFWFWTVTLAQAFATQHTLSDNYQYLTGALRTVPGPNLCLWILAGLGLALACWNRTTRRQGLFTGAFLAFSILAVSAGGVFNPHYFIMMLPGLALAAGAWVAAGEQMVEKALAGHATVPFARTLPLLCFAGACAYSVAAQSTYLFTMTPYEFARSTYGLNPFPEAVKVAEYIRSHSDRNAQIAVLGSEAEIYFYSGRRAATGYLFTYGLMETHRYAATLQGDMIGEIEASRPEYIVYVNVPTSWLARTDSSRAIFYWANDYAGQYYDRVGVVDLQGEEPAKYVWAPEARTYRPVSPYYLVLLRRK